MKNFIMKKMLQRQLKDVPEAEREKFIKMVEKDPDFFTKVAQEVKEKMDGGQDQMTATMSVMGKYKDKLKELSEE